MSEALVFLKLGGSLITDKDRPFTPRLETINRLAGEIAAALQARPGLKLLLGHGSGSYGHTPASKYGTRQGVQTSGQWRGFIEVWKEARALNEIVIAALQSAGLPVIAFPPSSAVTSRGGQVERWDLGPMHAALEAGLLPVINGDTIFDMQLGGTILSTEELFFYLAPLLRPQRILLAGLEPGVWADFPRCARLIDVLTPDRVKLSGSAIGGSASVDVTGGMRQKVAGMLRLAEELPGFEALIFSGKAPGDLRAVLEGDSRGTIIRKTT